MGLTYSDARWFRKLVLAGVLLGVAACSEQPTATRPQATFGVSGARGQRDSRLVTSGARYSDTSVKPATGRSGSAAVTAQAIWGGDGITELVVTPYRASDVTFSERWGCIEKVQVKLFSAAGRLLWSRNFNNLNLVSGASYLMSFADAPLGTRFQVQTNVKCIDNRRTDVVTAGPTVIRRTDPSVTALHLPNSALTDFPVSVTATVRELSGQLGATGTCNLYIDGSLSQSIGGVWVDAGGTVACAFALRFSTPGVRTIEVRFERSVPRDDDRSNNSASGTLPIVVPTPVQPSEPPSDPGLPATPPQPFGGSAQVYDDTVSSWDSLAYSYRLFASPYTLTDSAVFTYTVHGNEQSALLTGVIYEQIPPYLTRLVVSQVSGAVAYHSLNLIGVVLGEESGFGSQCLTSLAPEVVLSICSYEPTTTAPLGFTMVSYQRTAASAVYLSSAYMATFDGEALQVCP
ncbi:MAG: hypothetical protein AAB409_01495, partial [Gemmatimonadota bacterium]